LQLHTASQTLFQNFSHCALMRLSWSTCSHQWPHPASTPGHNMPVTAMRLQPGDAAMPQDFFWLCCSPSNGPHLWTGSRAWSQALSHGVGGQVGCPAPWSCPVVGYIALATAVVLQDTVSPHHTWTSKYLMGEPLLLMPDDLPSFYVHLL